MRKVTGSPQDAPSINKTQKTCRETRDGAVLYGRPQPRHSTFRRRRRVFAATRGLTPSSGPTRRATSHDPHAPSPLISKKRLRRTFRAGRFPPAHPTTRGAARAFPLVSKRRTWHARGSIRYLSSHSPTKTLRPQKSLCTYVSRYNLRSGMSRGSAAAESPLLLMSLLAFPSGVPSSQARHSRRGNTPKEALIPLSEALLFSGALRLTRDGSSYGMSLHRCGSSAASPFGRFRKPFITIPRHIHAHPAFKHRTIECRNALPTRYEASAFPSRWRKAADGLRPPRTPRPEDTRVPRALNTPVSTDRCYGVTALRSERHCTGAPRLLQDRMRSSSPTQPPRNSPKRYDPKPSTGSRPERLRSRFLLPAFFFPARHVPFLASELRVPTL